METHGFLAHINGDRNIQLLNDHTNGVARLCGEFCSQINPCWRNVGVALGLLHDQGKYQKAFQAYIRKASGLTELGPNRAPHSIAGAIYAYSLFKKNNNEALARVLAYCVGGHHRGLHDSFELDSALKMADNQRLCRDMLRDAPEVATTLAKQLTQQLRLSNVMAVDEEDRPLFIRMLFSALVDADYLDTEAFMDEERAAKRTETGEVNVLWETLRDKLKARTDSFDTATLINRTRAYFLNQCRHHGANHEPGIYSLFLPTGGGKTLSSMAWAIESAICRKASRIIYVIPYTSIITQTAEIFKQIFGEECVLEHHSEIDISDEDEYDKKKLLAENWDAPIVITTNVQMFESLYSHRPGRCRKLHNICNAVIVFDEVQMFPSGFLNPMLRAIESLTVNFGADILLCTATQPVFTQTFDMSRKQSNHFYSISVEIEDVVPYDRELFAAFDRVKYHTPLIRKSVSEIAEKLHQHPTVLCVVNTRSDAGTIYDAVMTLGRDKVEVVHLSRMMCSLHIRRQIAYIRQRLSEGLPIVVISTQLIEAGVDIDFPVVYRAHNGLDSIIQAGGRCNREGKLHSGDVYIFELTDGNKPWGEAKQGQQAANLIYRQIGDKVLNPNDPEWIRRYYTEYYGNQVNSFDKEKIEENLWSYRARMYLKLDFETASRNFRLIDEKDVINVYVPYGDEGKNLLKSLSRNKFISRQEFRTLQKLRVGIRKRDFESLRTQGVLEEVCLGDLPIWVLTYDTKYYDDARGLVCQDVWTDEILTL